MFEDLYPARSRYGGGLAPAFESSARRKVEELGGLNLEAAQFLLEEMRDVRDLFR